MVFIVSGIASITAGMIQRLNKLTKKPSTWLGISAIHLRPGIVGKKLQAIAPAIADAIKIAHILVLGRKGSAIRVARSAPNRLNNRVDSPTVNRYVTTSFVATKLLGTLVAVIPMAVLAAIPIVTSFALTINYSHILV
jgi:hypothetical protein